jgi:O-methyltransferase involved in polyketide biosynthesis
MKADQLSKTAAFIAIKFYGLTREKQYRQLFDASVIEFYDQLVASLPISLRYYHYWLQHNWVRKFYIWSEELLLPGDLLHVIARKWYMQHLIDQWMAKGYKQIIVLGAGFDHLAYFYVQQDLNCIEIDAPYMAQAKRQFLEIKYPNSTHPQIISSHLPENSLDKVFKETSDIDSSKKTLIIAEGFFDYLSAETVANSCGAIKNYFYYNPVLISTHFALNELSLFHRWVFKNSVALVNEKLQFNTSMADFDLLLSENEFNIIELYNSQQIGKKMQQLTGSSLPMLKGFYIFQSK